MKIAILYICTGKYSIFWRSFYDSCNRNFLPEMEKKFFVFSDTVDISESNSSVEIIYQKKLGWPFDTLMRFHLFSSISEKLKEFDYIFFFNANTQFVDLIEGSFLHSNGNLADLIVVQHPFFSWVVKPKDYPYERNRKSSAYIPFSQGQVYVMGGINGGKKQHYLELIETLKENIDQDQKKGIIARWHDESHLNKYIFRNKLNIKTLPYNYGYPEGHDLELKDGVMIQFLDKNKFGGHDALREKDNSIPVELKKVSVFKRILSAIKLK